MNEVAKVESAAKRNRELALQHLSRLTDKPLGHFIDGKPTEGEGGEPFDVLDPSTGQVLGQVLGGTASEDRLS